MAKEHLGEWVDGISDSPDSGPPNRDPSGGGSYDDDRDAVLRVFKEFCEKLDFRLSIFLENSPPMVDVFNEKTKLNAGMIGQKVHVFMAARLIDPVASELGYEYVSEPREPMRKFNTDSDQIYPDFRLLPRQWAGNTPPDIIGEIKKPGGAHKAVNDLGPYLLELKPPAYGIATDGIVWHGRKRTEDGISKLNVVSQVPLKPLLHKIRKGIVHDRMEFDLDQLQGSDSLTQFLTLFEQIP